MRAWKIEDGIAVNLIEVDSLDVFEGVLLVAADHGGRLGDHYDAETGEFTPPVAPPEPVPQEVTRRQGWQALFLAGVTEADVEAIINAIENDTERGLALIELRTATTFERHRPLVLAAGAALGLDLDQLFIDAAKL